MVVRLLVFPRAWVSVLFPSFSAQHAARADSLSGFYTRGVKVLLIATFPVMRLLLSSTWLRLPVVAAELVAYGALAWRWVLNGEERARVGGWGQKKLMGNGGGWKVPLGILGRDGMLPSAARNMPSLPFGLRA